MSKRFTDTGKYRKPFIRGLQGPYKVLWDYLYHECDHAGIWDVEWDVMQIRIGTDLPVDYKKAIEFFNTGEVRVKELDGGKKWLVVPFVGFQYGELNSENRVHNSVITRLEKYGIKGLGSPLQRAKDKDKDKDIDKDKDKDAKIEIPESLNTPDFLKAWA